MENTSRQFKYTAVYSAKMAQYGLKILIPFFIRLSVSADACPHF